MCNNTEMQCSVDNWTNSYSHYFLCAGKMLLRHFSVSEQKTFEKGEYLWRNPSSVLLTLVKAIDLQTNQKNCSRVLNFVSNPEGSGKTPHWFQYLFDFDFMSP